MTKLIKEMTKLETVRMIRALFPEDARKVSQLFGLALFYEAQGDFAKAEDYLEQAYEADKDADAK